MISPKELKWNKRIKMELHQVPLPTPPLPPPDNAVEFVKSHTYGANAE